MYLDFIYNIFFSSCLTVWLKDAQSEATSSSAFINLCCVFTETQIILWQTSLVLVLTCHLRFLILCLAWPCVHIQSSLTPQSNPNVTFLPSLGRQEVRSDLLCQSVNACQPLFRSLAWFDGWTLRRLFLHSEHTRIVFVPETFPLPDRRPRELGYDPHGNVTHGEIRPDRMMMLDIVTWNALLRL